MKDTPRVAPASTAVLTPLFEQWLLRGVLLDLLLTVFSADASG